MKVRVKQKNDQFEIDEVFTGATAEDIVKQMKNEVASKLNFLLRPLVNGMSPLAFAQEVVSRYNDHAKKNLRKPQSCEEFIELGEAEGIATIIEK